MPSGHTTKPASSPQWSRGHQFAWAVALILIGLLLRWGTLDVPFFSDDFMQLGMLAGLYPGEHANWDLYTFIRDDPAELAAHLEAGSLPWWTWSEINGSVLRPLSSLTLWLDYQLWPGDPRAAHLHNLLWWAAMVFAASRVFFGLLSTRVAALALAILALDHGVSTNVAWVANRCALICATFTFMAIAAHLRSRAAGPAVRPTTWVWLSLALLGGEYGLVAFAYLFAFEFLAADRSRAQRLRSLWPCAFPLLAYLSWHALGHYGTFGEAIYAHPLRAPLAYLEWLATRMPRALADLAWSFPPSPGELMERANFRWLGLPALDALSWLPEGEWQEDFFAFVRVQSAVAAALVVSLLVIWRALRPQEGGRLPQVTTRPVQGLALGAVIGLLPLLVAPADSRTLAICQLGAAPVVATLLWTLSDRVRARPRGPALAWLPLIAWLAGVHLIADPAYSVKRINSLRRTHTPITESFEQLGESEGLAGRHVIVLSSLSHNAALHGGIALELMGHAPPQSWRVLSMGTSALTLQRVDERTLIAIPTGAPLLSSPVEHFFRPPRAPIERGELFSSGPMQVEVLSKGLGEDGREAPLDTKSLRLRFSEALERYIFLRTNPESGALEVVALPEAPGMLRIARPVVEEREN